MDLYVFLSKSHPCGVILFFSSAGPITQVNTSSLFARVHYNQHNRNETRERSGEDSDL